MIRYLHCDFETFSLVDLREVGLDNYAKHPSTGISMLAWSVDDDPEIDVWLPTTGPMPKKLLALFDDPEVIIISWNAQFEHAIFNHVLKIPLEIQRFRDPIVLAHNLSLPGKLASVGEILKMGNQKDPRGDELVKMFSGPVSRGGEMTLFGMTEPLFRTQVSHPREFAEYIEYCKQDVRTSRDLWNRLCKIPFPEHEWHGWFLDHKINALGIPGRRDLAEKGWRLANRFIDEQRALLKKITGLENPNSDVQMKKWATERGYPWNSMRAPIVRAEINNLNSPITAECRTAFKVRASARKSSYTKIEKFLQLLSSDDDRLRYQFRFLGAPRTGRWASGGGEEASMQVQNLPRGEKAVKKKLMLALDLLAREDYDGIIKEFTNTPNEKDSITVVEFVITLLRSLFQAKPGKVFHVADKNAIENRVLGWAAGCDAILDVFRHTKDDGGDPYLAFGTKLYNKTYAEMWAAYKAGNEEDRQNSKPAVLGAGYGLGGGEMFINEYGDEVRGGLWGYALAVCGTDMPKELAHKAVKIFRESYPEVVVFWYDLEEAFKQVLRCGGVIKVGEVTWDREEKEWVEHPTKGQQCVLTFSRIKMSDGGYTVRMQLPSGRALHYLNATIDQEERTSKRDGHPYKVDTLHYDGVEHSATQGADGKTQKKHHSWGRVKTYGGKLCLGAQTQIVTNRGIIPLHSVGLCDKIWDGVSWIRHGGLIYNGNRDTQSWMGLETTADHQILAGNEWRELGKITNQSGVCSLLRGLDSAIRLWCFQSRENVGGLACDAIAASNSKLIPEHYGVIKSISAPPVVAGPLSLADLKKPDMLLSPIPHYEPSGLEKETTSSSGATIPKTKLIITTEDEGLRSGSHGEETLNSGFGTRQRYPDGMIPLSNLIELTITEIMNQATSDWFPHRKIQIIVEQLSLFLGSEKNCRINSFVEHILHCGVKTLSRAISNEGMISNGAWTDIKKQRVYDLRECGPRHRFMVVTDAGPVIVHNCENAVQAISRDDLLNSMVLADEMGFHIVGMFHDEVMCEEDDDPWAPGLSDLIWAMTQVPDWANGLILGAEGFTSKVYKK